MSARRHGRTSDTTARCSAGAADRRLRELGRMRPPPRWGDLTNVNSLVLAVVERTHELGMLRGIGMTRRQMGG